jgi:hypothetical protein
VKVDALLIGMSADVTDEASIGSLADVADEG